MEWYEGGNLFSKKVKQWKKATYENKLATCGSFLALMFSKHWPNNFVVWTNSIDHLKSYAEQLVETINHACDHEDLEKIDVSEMLNLGINILGFVDGKPKQDITRGLLGHVQ